MVMAPQKLSKKQKKSIAFRDRKGKAKSLAHDGVDDAAGLDGLEDNQVPVLEVQDDTGGDGDASTLALAAEPGAALDNRPGKAPRVGKAKAKDPLATATPTASTKKRKRDSAAAAVDGEVDVAEAAPPKRKKAKALDTTGLAVDGGVVKADQGKVKQRFILFVGNLKYTTTAETLKAHFSVCDPPPTVRLRTPKPSAPGKPVIKSKGCAFLEFTHRNALQQGLKLHLSEIEGRRINVELSAGGGGKGEGRLKKLKERNKSLSEQRKDQKEKLARADPSLSTVPDLPQRFSATSGLEQVQSKRRTWTVGDVDDGETHRGGKKHTKSRSRGKQWGTGVNAIPVG